MPNTCQPGAHDEFVQHTHVLQGLRQLDQRGVPVPARLLLGDHVQPGDLPCGGKFTKGWWWISLTALWQNLYADVFLKGALILIFKLF